MPWPNRPPNWEQLSETDLRKELEQLPDGEVGRLEVDPWEPWKVQKIARLIANEREIAAWPEAYGAVTPTAQPYVPGNPTGAKMAESGNRIDSAAAKALDEYPVPKVWRANDLKPAMQAKWVAKGWIPRAATTILVGDEGIGKSLFWVLVAAAVSNGKPMPECGIPARDPAHVIIVCTEDDWSTCVRPRLVVAGADLDMIHVICTHDDGSGAPVFPRDIGLLDELDHLDVALVVVDAWLDTVPSNLTVRDPQGARLALHPWKEVATRLDAGIILLTHTNRLSTGNARDKYGITSELRKKARMTLYAQQDDDGRLVIGPEKSNSTALASAAAFVIEPVQHFQPTDDDDGTVALLVHAGATGQTSRQHLADAFESEFGDDKQSRTEAQNWLEDYLNIEGPDADSAEAKKAAAKAGFTLRTLQRARHALKVVIHENGYPRRTTWSLPLQAPANQGSD